MLIYKYLSLTYIKLNNKDKYKYINILNIICIIFKYEDIFKLKKITIFNFMYVSMYFFILKF